MEAILTITESDYLAISQWDEDGGAPCNVSYRVVPDQAATITHKSTRKPLENRNPEQGGANSLAKTEAVGV
jgi:hypothetical protein